MSASMEARIAKHAAPPIPPTSPAYDQAPLGHRAAMIRMRDDIPEEDMPPRRRFVLAAPPPRQGLLHNLESTTECQLQAYVRSQRVRISIHSCMMLDIRLEIDVVRGQRTAYEAELHERQRAEDDAARQMMPTHVLEARAQIDTVEDTGSSCHDAAYAMTWGTLKKKLTNKYCPKSEIKKLEIELWNLRVKGNDVAAYTQRFQELALMCTKFLADETEKVDKYIMDFLITFMGMSCLQEPKTPIMRLTSWPRLMDQKLRTYAERQNDNKRKAEDSSRNNQQPHKKQNVARAYTAGPGSCYKCGNTGHIKKNFPKLKNRENNNGNGTAQGRAYALGGRDASLNSNVITGTFPLNNHYALILFDTGADRSFGCDVFLAHITTKEAKDKSEEKRLEDVPIVRDFPEVFLEDLPGIPPA
ncbi:putative reverse transcriptase domain-containing protein [Tanacetum coccineum]